eukprot:2471022-Rhodomonas_salina.1
MSGTEVAYGASCLRASYAMSGTDLVYGAMRCPVLRKPMGKVLPGPEGAQQLDPLKPVTKLGWVRSPTTALRDVRYWHSVLCYAMFGTDVVCGDNVLCSVICGTVLCNVRY